MNNIPDNWYESFFTGINVEMWQKAVSQEWTDDEAAFLKDVLGLNPGASILDLPCGTGQAFYCACQTRISAYCC